METPAALLVLCAQNPAKAGFLENLEIISTSLGDLIAEYLHLRPGHILNMLRKTVPQPYAMHTKAAVLSRAGCRILDRGVEEIRGSFH